MEFTTCFGLHFQATRLEYEQIVDQPHIVTGLPPSMGSQSRDLTPDKLAEKARTNATVLDRTNAKEIQRWANSCSLAVTREIIFIFFSSAY